MQLLYPCKLQILDISKQLKGRFLRKPYKLEVSNSEFGSYVPLKGGGGANGYFFVKLDFEIAVDQQTRTSDRTFEGVPNPNRQTVPAGQPRPYLVQIRPNLAKYPEHAQNPYFMCSTCS